MANETCFGDELRRWRNKRGKAQLDLAYLAGYSQRHISFLESGRSKPSRESVMVLAEALDIPLKERNFLLQSAGFAPIFTSEPLDSEFLRFAIQALEAVLQSHRPFPAIVVDRAWNMYAGNENAFEFFRIYLGSKLAVHQGSPLNVLQLCISPEGLRPYIRNWSEFARNIFTNLKRELDFDSTNESIRSLIREFESDPEVAGHTSITETPRLTPFSTLELEKDGKVLKVFTLISQFANPNDVTLSELRVETFLPANDETRNLLIAIDAQLVASMLPREKTESSVISWSGSRTTKAG